MDAVSSRITSLAAGLMLIGMMVTASANTPSRSEYSVGVARVQHTAYVGAPDEQRGGPYEGVPYYGSVFQVRLEIERVYRGVAPIRSFEATVIAAQEQNLTQPGRIVIVYRTHGDVVEVAHWHPVGENGEVCLSRFNVERFALEDLDATTDAAGSYCFR